MITFALLLLALWFLGIIGVYTIGWVVHVFLVVAVIVLAIRLIRGAARSV